MKDGRHFGTPELRKKLKAHYRECAKAHQEWIDAGYPFAMRIIPPFPEECRGMLCGAKTRSGRPCRNDGTSYSNGRCKFHGGASTGPKTEAGKKQSAINGRNNTAKRLS
jgi:hypothetical protein